MNEKNGGETDLAPVIPLFVGSVARGAVQDAEGPGAPASWNSTWADDADDDEHGAYDEPEDDAGGTLEREIAEANLLKRLRTRQLSVVEARAIVAERDVDRDTVDDIIDAFCRRGYLDDARLAEQLVYSGVDRRGQGRRAIGQTLAKRGIPRDVADAVLATLPDDDAERALDFARTRAKSMASLDRTTAERRLAGQLSRRGYGSVALSAARQALDELSGGRRGVRFD